MNYNIKKGDDMIDLYILENCPYSIKVMNFFKSHNIEYKKRDITDPENLKLLIELGGKKQVPFLHDDDNNISMYESEDIINYIKSKV